METTNKVDVEDKVKVATALVVLSFGGVVKCHNKEYFINPEFDCVVYRNTGETTEHSSKLKIHNAESQLAWGITDEHHNEHCKFIMQWMEKNGFPICQASKCH